VAFCEEENLGFRGPGTHLTIEDLFKTPKFKGRIDS
jgi:hypothetical protein